MDESELRVALEPLDRSTPLGADQRKSVLALVTRRRRRRKAAVVGVVAALSVGGVAALNVVVDRQADGVPEQREPSNTDRESSISERHPPTKTWSPIATSPLAPRHGAVGAWTGEELVIVGGATANPCPPNADCALLDQATNEAAAYDPASNSWRALPPAPVPISGGAGVWSGEKVIVVSGRTTMAYQPRTEQWRRLEDKPSLQENEYPIVTDLGIVYVSYDQGETDKPVDWVLDPKAGTWSALPSDPFGESYDRSLAWDGERLWLLSMSVDFHFQASEGAPSRVAVLEGDTWRVVEDETPPLTYEQRWAWDGERFVIPAGSDGTRGRTYDPVTGTWAELPVQSGACSVVGVGAGPDWVGNHGSLASGSPADAIAVPDCPGLPEPDVAVWADDQLIIWGGPAEGYRGNSNQGLIWTPPLPVG